MMFMVFFAGRAEVFCVVLMTTFRFRCMNNFNTDYFTDFFDNEFSF